MSTTIPAGPPPGVTDTSAIIPGYRLAELQISSALAELARITYAVARERDTAVRDLEEQRQEVGKLRARVAELEVVLRDATESFVDHEADADSWFFAARVALGLDGASGHRDVNAEVSGG